MSGPAVKDVSWTEGGAADRVPSRYDFTLVFNEGLVQTATTSIDSRAELIAMPSAAEAGLPWSEETAGDAAAPAYGP